MRTLTAAESAALDAAVRQNGIKVEIQNGDGTWIDYSDRLIGGGFGRSENQSITSVSVELRRDRSPAAANSLSPFMERSSLNRLDDGATFSPAVDAGRGLRISIATVAAGTTPTAGDHHLVFRGITDETDTGKNPLTVEAHDLGSHLKERFIEQETTYEQAAMEDMIQSIFSDWTGDITLYSINGTAATPFDPADAPGYTVNETTFDGISVWNAAERIAQLNGWTVRFRWNENVGDYVATLMEPDRDRETDPAAPGFSADWTHRPNRYYVVPRLATGKRGVRNAIGGHYHDEDGVKHEVATITDSFSIAKYDRQFFGLREGTDSPINTLPEFQTMQGKALADLKDPAVDQEIELPLFWPVELGDLYLFKANGVHYDVDQGWTVVGYRHNLTRERTTITVRGKASGGYRNWLERPTRPGETGITGPRIARVFTSSQTETQITKTFWTEAASEVWLYINQAPQGTPEPLTFNSAGEVVDENGVAVEPLLLTVTNGATSHTFTLPPPDEVIYLMAEPRDSDLEAGEIWEGEIHPIDRDLTVTPYPRQEGSTGILRLEINDPRLVASGDAEFRTKLGTDDAYGAWVSTWDSTTGVAGTDENLVREEAIALAAKHTGSIEYRVPFTDEDGVQRYQSGEHTFDLDRIAETGGFIHFSATGEIIVVGIGDEDATKHYVTAKAGTPPLDPTAASNNGTIAARVGAVNTTVACALGQVAYAKIVAEDANGNLGPAVTVEMRRGVGENLPFEYGYDVSQSGSTGTMAVEVYDETKAVLGLKFQKRSGTAGFGGTWLTTWDGSTGLAGTDTRLQRSESVALAEKHTSDIKVLIEFRDEDGNDHIEGSIVYPPVIFGHSFDLDTIAEITSIAPGIDNSGAVFATVTADEDTANRYIRVTTDGTTPTDPTSASNDGSGAGRSGRIAATGKTAAAGDVVTVKAVGYDSGGNPGPVQSTRWTVPHDPGAETNPAAIRDTVVLTNDTGTGGNNVYTATWKWNVATTSSYTVDIEYYENGVKVGTTTGTPATDGMVSFTDTGAGDGAADDHHGIMFLYNPSSELVATFKTFTIKSTI